MYSERIKKGEPLPGFLSYYDKLKGWKFLDYEEDHGNRQWAFDCGCFATSGGGSYGSFGSAVCMDKCYKHAE